MAQFLVKAFKSLQDGGGFPVLLGILAALVLIGYLVLSLLLT